jgi:Flp pilus assembly protein TadB
MSVCSRRTFPSSPRLLVDHATGDGATSKSRHEARADWQSTPKQLGCKLNDAFRHCPRQSANQTSTKKLGNIMVVLGIILIVLGLLLPSLVPTFAFAHIVLVLGVILLVVGLLLMVAGRMGHAVGGRRHYY